MANAPLPMIERRRIEAAILKEVYETLRESHGDAVAKAAVKEAVRRSAVAQAREMAAQVPATSFQTFIDLRPRWTADGALVIEEKERTENRFLYHVTRCRYAEMYKEMGLAEIGPLLSCERDGSFCDGYDPKLKLKRTQTIMEGATHCDFDFSYEG